MLVKRRKSQMFFAWLMEKPARMICFSFLFIDIIGVLLLVTPFVTNSGKSIGLFDALFTTVSATCVTGLVVRDTATTFNTFGRFVIIMLIQVGGLGLVTITTFFLSIIRRRIGLRTRVLAQESSGSFSFTELPDLLRSILLITISFELIGFVSFSTQFVPKFGWKTGLAKSGFLAISSFCNAGFDLMGDTASGPFSSLTAYSDNPVVLMTTIFLVCSGGLGFIVWRDMIDFVYHRIQSFIRRDKSVKSTVHIRLHSRITIFATITLIVVGTLLLLILEWNNKGDMAIGTLPIGDRLLAALFQSVSMRTAGFNSINLMSMHEGSKIICVVLMFIGAGSGSTGGGIKVTTFSLLFFSLFSDVKGSEDVVYSKHKIARTSVQRATTIFTLGLSLMVLLSVILTITEHAAIVDGKFQYIDMLFEAASAFGTVGVTSASTASLSTLGQFFIIPVMFIGRVGPATFAISLALRDEKPYSKVFPEGRIHIG